MYSEDYSMAYRKIRRIWCRTFTDWDVLRKSQAYLKCQDVWYFLYQLLRAFFQSNRIGEHCISFFEVFKIHSYSHSVLGWWYTWAF